MTATVTIERNLVVCRVQYNEDILAVLKSVPGGVWNRRYGAWEYPLSGWSVFELRRKLAPFVTVRASPEAEKLEERALRALAAHREPGQFSLPESKTVPWQHQQRGFCFVRTIWGEDGGAAALWWEMGTGKSRVAVDLVQSYGFARTLILCPKHVMDVWPAQFAEHAIEPPPVFVLEQEAVSDRAAYLNKVLPLHDRVVFVANQEGCWREPLATALLKADFDCLISDEHHRLKQHDGKAATFVAKLARQVPFILALSGTPLPHSPLDAFQQYRILDPGIFGNFFTRFKDRYAVAGGYRVNGKPVQIVGWKNLEDLHERMYRIAYRIEASDVLDLPQSLDIVRTCELEPKARAAYNQLAREFVADVENGRITATNALVKLLRLQQITSGDVTNDSGVTVAVSNAKSELLENVLADMPENEPVVIFARFHADLDRIKAVCRKLGRTVSELSGRMHNLKEWETGKTTVLAAQIATGGLGISLVRAHYCIFYSLGFNLAEFLQAKARVNRPGQHFPVRYIYLLAKRTVDAQVYSALARRQDVVESILAGVKQLALDSA
jgi:hypothetical protein